MKRKLKAASKTHPRSTVDSVPPKSRPAFCPFTLDTEPAGEPSMRGLVRRMYASEYAPNASAGLDTLYRDAIGRPCKWDGCCNQAGEIVLREKHKPIAQKDAAQALVEFALDAVTYVGLLYARRPDLCREVASPLPHWPVSADRTDPAWQRKAQRLIEDLKLGAAIEGFIRSERTSIQNPIRRYATTIYHTLFQTRCQFKEADEKWHTRRGCPPWAAKTLDLPLFTKANARAWAVLGKEMLLQQHPSFMEEAALKEQKFKWTKRAENRSKSGNPKGRAILNEAFGDFAKELRKLAPVENISRGNW